MTACHLRNEASPLHRRVFTRPHVPSSVPDRRRCQRVPVTFVPNLFTPNLTCCVLRPLIGPSDTETGTVAAGEGTINWTYLCSFSFPCSSLSLSLFFVFTLFSLALLFFLSLRFLFSRSVFSRSVLSLCRLVPLCLTFGRRQFDVRPLGGGRNDTKKKTGVRRGQDWAVMTRPTCLFGWPYCGLYQHPSGGVCMLLRPWRGRQVVMCGMPQQLASTEEKRM